MNDWISWLPDDILVSILSSLPLKDAGRTSVLSSRWKNMWKNTSHLNFVDDSALDKIGKDQRQRNMERSKYVRWVNSVLKSLLHKGGLTLEDFRICFDVGKSSSEAISQWLKFAFERQVEKLELDLLEFGHHMSLPGNVYVFPDKFLFQNSCVLHCPHPPTTCTTLFNFKSLRSLSFKNVQVSGEAIEFFLHNCPFLEQLILHDIEKLSKLEVCGSCLVLKHLELCCIYDFISLEVSAPNLISLSVGTTNGLVLKNVPMLVDLHIRCAKVEIPLLVPALCCCVSQLEILSLFLEMHRAHHIVMLNFPDMPKLKRLDLSFQANRKARDESVLKLTSLIRKFPILEEFVLEIIWFGCYTWTGREVTKVTQFPHQHLKVFKYLGYDGHSSDSDAVMFILENCVVLQEIIIDPICPPYPWHAPLGKRELEAAQMVRSCAKQLFEPRVSEHVRLIIQ
ncbi:unnamed protein product [Cuscuta epithymum]|uniref:F-box domain-containing protein n=1 Tax=Cuscuta epithymum TaxID=186058 RepID=A0AAV0D452_9ASTE|nr:unnamed protein product [Cuscuta epithymum]